MIRSVHVGNFKAFAETQNIPIRPITLIFGPNSAGKSSILHAALFAQNALETGDLDAHHVSRGGEAVDLGGFRQFIHGGKVERPVQIGLSFAAEDLAQVLDDRRTATWGALGESTDWRRILSDARTITLMLFVGIEVDDLGEPLPSAKPRLITYEIIIGDNLQIRFSRVSHKSMRLTVFDTQHSFGKEFLAAVISSFTTTEIQPSEELALKETLDNAATQLMVSGDEFVPRGLANISADQRVPIPLGFIAKDDRVRQMKETLLDALPRTIDELLQGIHHFTAETMSTLTYLGPLRSYPPRHLAFERGQDLNWYAGGGYAWDVLRNDSEVRKKVNKWLGSSWLQTRYELKVRDLISDHLLSQDLPSKVSDAISEAFKSWLQTKSTSNPLQLREFITSLYEQIVVDDQVQLYDESPLKGFLEAFLDVEKNSERWTLELAQRSPDQLKDLVMIDKRSETPVTHRDVGIGISQVLPVLVYCYASQKKIIAIEQPEIHLHPALQSELADVFIESALGERRNSFFLETHSEHLILRILRRIRETSEGTIESDQYKLRPEDVSVVYVRPAKNGSIVQHIEITPEGEFATRWPDGFFDDRAKELF